MLARSDGDHPGNPTAAPLPEGAALMSPFFLDVERSLTGRPWRARLDAAGEARALAITQIAGQDELMSRILAGRGVGIEGVERHLDPTLRDLMPVTRRWAYP